MKFKAHASASVSILPQLSGDGRSLEQKSENPKEEPERFVPVGRNGMATVFQSEKTGNYVVTNRRYRRAIAAENRRKNRKADRKAARMREGYGL